MQGLITCQSVLNRRLHAQTQMICLYLPYPHHQPQRLREHREKGGRTNVGAAGWGRRLQMDDDPILFPDSQQLSTAQD